MENNFSLKDRIVMALKNTYAVEPEKATRQQVFDATAHTLRDYLMPYYMKSKNEHYGKKNLFYMCMEFLLGRTLNNTLMNIGIFDEYSGPFYLNCVQLIILGLLRYLSQCVIIFCGRRFL